MSSCIFFSFLFFFLRLGNLTISTLSDYLLDKNKKHCQIQTISWRELTGGNRKVGLS